MEIKPTYVSFEQAKLLKEKGFDVITNKLYYYNGSDFITLINKNSENFGFSAPEQWQVLEYLRVNHGIHITLTTYALGYQYRLNNTPDPKTWHIDKRYDCKNDFKTPQEAYSGAFDYILKELI